MTHFYILTKNRAQPNFHTMFMKQSLKKSYAFIIISVSLRDERECRGFIITHRYLWAIEQKKTKQLKKKSVADKK